MAVFFKNDCTFNGCGLRFPTLSDLIEHIEESHIDFDSSKMQAYEDTRPLCIPLSYVLRYSESHSRPMKEIGSYNVKLRLLHHASKSFGEKCHGGQQNEDNNTESESESSNDSWKPSKEVTTFEREFFFFKYRSMKHLYPPDFSRKRSNVCYFKEKPFACTVPGCKKRYKNTNGIRYHYKHAHKMCQRTKKGSFKHLLRKKNGDSKKIHQHNISNPILNASSVSYTIAHPAEQTWFEDNLLFDTYEGIENMESYLSLFNCNVNTNANFTWSPVPVINNNNNNELTILKSINQNDSPNSTYAISDF